MTPWRATTTRGRWVLVTGLALAAAGVLLRYPVVAALGAVLATLVVVEVALVLRRPPVRVQRTVEPLVVVRQESCTGRLRLAGGRGGLVRTLARESIDGRLGEPFELDPQGAETTYVIPTTRRGLVDVGPLRLERASLCGLSASATDAGEVVRLRVLPRRVPLTALPTGHRRAAVGGGESMELGGTDLVGLHEYAVGDDLRRLHWATSARTGTLMVREDADPAQPHVHVLLDDRSESYAAADDFEEAVEVAAALCRVAVEAGDPLRFRTTSGRHDVTVPGSTTRQPLREAHELEWLLAEIDAGPDRTPVAAHHRGLDVAVAVTGARADHRGLALDVGGALDATVCVVDPDPAAGPGVLGAATVLRGAGSDALARLWDGRHR
ncbi:uncharacterized protein (DUF58 family) [Nocardioides cavernae]|uniref:Uncharacterized protein (DUF58 family) n=1 Tax=Nocardioides cavernae TaxID=1921566 RepID=A0A7Y9GZD6_9ACTN|nr:DUF58 domain-containing protein [Nocardioides cavernae]NYE35135.1 uncharacterized protein (DUF58 family) [Nocardioides cavernae]